MSWGFQRVNEPGGNIKFEINKWKQKLAMTMMGGHFWLGYFMETIGIDTQLIYLIYYKLIPQVDGKVLDP